MSLRGEGGERQLSGITSTCLAGAGCRCWDTYCISLSDSKTQFSSPGSDIARPYPGTRGRASMSSVTAEDRPRSP